MSKNIENINQTRRGRPRWRKVALAEKSQKSTFLSTQKSTSIKKVLC